MMFLSAVDWKRNYQNRDAGLPFADLIERCMTYGNVQLEDQVVGGVLRTTSLFWADGLWKQRDAAMITLAVVLRHLDICPRILVPIVVVRNALGESSIILSIETNAVAYPRFRLLRNIHLLWKGLIQLLRVESWQSGCTRAPKDFFRICKDLYF